jgi:hypothetical protein
MNMNIKIADALSKRPRHRLVKHDMYGIVERLKEIEDGYFVLQDKVTGSYEVHSTLNTGNTYCFTVPYGRLDARTLEYCRRTSTGRNVVAMVEKNNNKIDASRERAKLNDMEARTAELADRLSYAREQDSMHDGYKRVFSM